MQKQHLPTNVTVVDFHGLAKAHLTEMRDVRTSRTRFKLATHGASLVVAHAVTADLETQQVGVQTPNEFMESGTEMVDEHPPLLVPILRAGKMMAGAFGDYLYRSPIKPIDMSRNETTFKAVLHGSQLADDLTNRHVIVLDVMLATGGSTICAVDLCKRRNAERITVASILAAPEGLDAFHAVHPDVRVYVLQVDRCLNDHKFIMPGLGDAGDRGYGKKKRS